MRKMLTTLTQLSKNKYIEKETGYLVCENAVLGSTGYQEYFAYELGIDNLPPNQRIKVYRPAEEVFKDESLATLENKALCVLHPDVPVTSQNDGQLRKGSVYNVRQEGDVIKGTLQITDQDTIDKIKYIKCLSLGYDLDLEPSDDVNTDGTVFTARNIRYNHIALVPKGRSKVDMITDMAIEDKNIIGGETMSLFKKSDVSVEDAEKEKAEVEETKADDACEYAMDESAEKAEKVERRDEREGAEEDTVTKEIEKRIAKGDYTQKDLEKLLSKLRSKEGRKEAKEDYKEREEYRKEKDEKAKAKDSVTISTDEYKALLMGNKGLVFGNDTSAFQKVEAKDTKATALDAEEERRKYYKNTLNPHKNPNYRAECGMLDDLID